MRVQAIIEIAGWTPQAMLHAFGRGFLCIYPLVLLQQPLGAQPVRYDTVKGKIRIEGTSNIDDWQVENRSMTGYFNAGSDFPGGWPQDSAARSLEAHAEVLVEVGSLKSIEKDGKPFSNLMDEIMHGKLKSQQYPKIQYRLKELRLTAHPKIPDEAYRFESKGDLVVAGVTNSVMIPINVTRIDAQRLRIWGNTSLRMTDFKIEPPAPKIALGIVKTGDEVKLSFEWVIAEAGRPHSAAAGETFPR